MPFSAPVCLRVQKGRRKYTGLKQSFRGEIKLVLDWRVKILSTLLITANRTLGEEFCKYDFFLTFIFKFFFIV